MARKAASADSPPPPISPRPTRPLSVSTSTMVGTTLGHYEVLAKLGEGGMGVVYEARDRRLDRRVAIKILPPAKVSDPARKQRFIQEAKAASALNHPNIITIYDIDSENSCDY